MSNCKSPIIKKESTVVILLLMNKIEKERMHLQTLSCEVLKNLDEKNLVII